MKSMQNIPLFYFFTIYTGIMVYIRLYKYLLKPRCKFKLYHIGEFIVFFLSLYFSDKYSKYFRENTNYNMNRSFIYTGILFATLHGSKNNILYIVNEKMACILMCVCV